MSRPDHAVGTPAQYQLRLFVVGPGPASLRAIRDAKSLCESRLAGRFELEIVDLRLHPEEARALSVVALPVLVKERPGRARSVVGRLSDADHVLAGLGIRPVEDA